MNFSEIRDKHVVSYEWRNREWLWSITSREGARTVTAFVANTLIHVSKSTLAVAMHATQKQPKVPKHVEGSILLHFYECLSILLQFYA